MKKVYMKEVADIKIINNKRKQHDTKRKSQVV
jgi:hypothetical protein